MFSVYIYDELVFVVACEQKTVTTFGARSELFLQPDSVYAVVQESVSALNCQIPER